jgi:SAM-dependent methyltransferase
MPVRSREIGWRVFEKEAPKYEAWYATSHGRKVDRAERALLDWLLASFAQAQSVAEIGCGTGHFTRWFAKKLTVVIGLDRAPNMLTEFRKVSPDVPIILGDAHRLPIRDGGVDLSALVLSLEFLEDPLAALAEAVRVARKGVLLVVLNRWSLGGFSRRIGPQRRGAILSRAEDRSVTSLKSMARKASGTRLRHILWTSTLFPDGIWKVCFPIPLGDVLGVALLLGP